MSTETQISAQEGKIQSVFEVGLLGILVSFGLFQRMFMGLLTRNDFIIPFVIIIGAFLIGSILIFTILPIQRSQLRKWTYKLNFIVIVIAYLFLFNMPESSSEFRSPAFDNWDPFTIGGNLIFLILYMGSQIVMIIFHLEALRCLNHETDKISPESANNLQYIFSPKTSPIPTTAMKGKLYVWLPLGLFCLIAIIYGRFDPKFYMLLSICLLLIEIIAVFNKEDQNNEASEILTPKIPSNFKELRSPGAFALVWGNLLMIIPIFIAIAAQDSQGDNVPSIIWSLPHILLGIWLSGGFLHFLAWKGWNSTFWRYTALLVTFMVVWIIFLLNNSFDALDTLAAWIILGLILGNSLSLFRQLIATLGKSRSRRISLPFIYFIFVISFVVVFSVKISFDHNSWVIFLYVIFGLDLWGIICGLIALIQWRRAHKKLTLI